MTAAGLSRLAPAGSRAGGRCRCRCRCALVQALFPSFAVEVTPQENRTMFAGLRKARPGSV